MKTAKLLLILFGILFGIAGLVIGIWSAIDPVGAFNIIKNVDTNIISLVLMIGLPLLFVVIFVPIFGGFMKGSRIKKRLQENGVKKQATVITVADTGTTINDNPYVEITVETTKGTHAKFRALVSRVAIPRPGDQIDILYDPSDPTIATLA